MVGVVVLGIKCRIMYGLVKRTVCVLHNSGNNKTAVEWVHYYIGAESNDGQFADIFKCIFLHENFSKFFIEVYTIESSSQ